jgi:hypothetical protein
MGLVIFHLHLAYISWTNLKEVNMSIRIIAGIIHELGDVKVVCGKYMPDNMIMVSEDVFKKLQEMCKEKGNNHGTRNK